LAINALSAITPDIESNHKQTCYNFVSTICLWYKTVDYLRCISPKTPQQQIQLGYLTHTDQTDLLAQFMLDHVKRCDHCMYICMARLNKRATEPVFSIAQNHSVLLTDISGRIHPDPVEQFYQLKLQEQQRAHQQLLHQQQQTPQLTSNVQGTLQPQNYSLHNTKSCNNISCQCIKWFNTISRISHSLLCKYICNLLYRFLDRSSLKPVMAQHHMFHHNQLLSNNNNNSILFLTKSLLKVTRSTNKKNNGQSLSNDC